MMPAQKVKHTYECKVLSKLVKELIPSAIVMPSCCVNN